jgi:hypothetical protein
MEEEKEFYVMRYLMVEESQSSLAAKELPRPKGAAILNSILGDREFKLNGVDYSFVGFSAVEPTGQYNFPSNRFYIGKTAKKRSAHVGEKIPGDILERKEDDWIPLYTVFDIVGQYIFVKKDWRFGRPEQIAMAIQTGLRSIVLADYNHRVFVEGKTKKEAFWNIVNNHNKVYKIDLRLVSPNILNTNLKARDALKALKELFEQDEIDLSLKNDSGSLKVPEDPLTDYVEYISEGEGGWAITTEGKHGGKKKHSSLENTITVDLPVPSYLIIEDEKQLELDTSMPAITRAFTDSRLIAQVYAEIRNLSEY